MVEAQQARLSELGEQGLVNIVSDANRVIMRRFIERLIAEERKRSRRSRSFVERVAGRQTSAPRPGNAPW